MGLFLAEMFRPNSGFYLYFAMQARKTEWHLDFEWVNRYETIAWRKSWSLSLPKPVEAKYSFNVGKNLCIEVGCD